MLEHMQKALIRLREAGAEDVRFVVSELDVYGLRIVLRLNFQGKALCLQLGQSGVELSRCNVAVAEIEKSLVERLADEMERELNRLKRPGWENVDARVPKVHPSQQARIVAVADCYARLRFPKHDVNVRLHTDPWQKPIIQAVMYGHEEEAGLMDEINAAVGGWLDRHLMDILAAPEPFDAWAFVSEREGADGG